MSDLIRTLRDIGPSTGVGILIDEAADQLEANAALIALLRASLRKVEDEAEALKHDIASALDSLTKESVARCEAEDEVEGLRVDADRWRALLESVTTEIDDREYSHVWKGTENAPGHGHEKPGVWDRDNGHKAGKACAWCATWNAARAALSANAEGKKS